MACINRLVLVVAAIFLASLTGYVWMGEGGAAAFALAGLWGCYAAPRPWAMGRAALLLLLAGMTVVPGVLWAAGMYRPEFADAIYAALEPVLVRLLDFTHADEEAHALLAARGDMHCWPAIRLGIATSWLYALPSAAALMLWFNEMPAHWPTGAQPARRMRMVALTVGMLVAASLLLTFPPRRLLSPVVGAVAYPALFCLWLLAIAGLRAWAHLFAAGPGAAEQAPTP